MRVLRGRFIALACAVGIFSATVTLARADPYSEALSRFTEDSFESTIEGISGVTASRNPLAPHVIAALQAGRLLFSTESKRVLLRDRFDRLIDAATGAAADENPPDDLAPVRLNNRLRRIIEAALG